MIKLSNIVKERINSNSVEVRKLNTKEEKDLFDEYVKLHYLQKLPSSVNIRFGIFHENEMIGIIAYGMPTFAGLLKSFHLDSGELYELRRLWIRDDAKVPNIESQAISLGNKELKDLYPKTKVVVTYADPTQGHVGTIYQSTNAKYLGKGAGPTGKHKYIYLLGDRREVKNTIQRMKLNVNEPLQYPKRTQA